MEKKKQQLPRTAQDEKKISEERAKKERTRVANNLKKRKEELEMSKVKAKQRNK